MVWVEFVVCVCVCVGKEVFCYNQIYFGSIVLCLQYFHTLGGYFLCVGRQVFCSIQNDTCIGIKHIYIYIYIERERERETYKMLYISSSVFLFALYFQASTIHKMLKIKLLIQAIFILF